MVDDLQAERSRLQPLTEADKTLVDRLFQEQEVRVSKRLWKDRSIGFGIGVASSLAAAWLFKRYWS